MVVTGEKVERVREREVAIKERRERRKFAIKRKGGGLYIFLCQYMFSIQ